MDWNFGGLNCVVVSVARVRVCIGRRKKEGADADRPNLLEDDRAHLWCVPRSSRRESSRWKMFLIGFPWLHATFFFEFGETTEKKGKPLARKQKCWCLIYTYVYRKPRTKFQMEKRKNISFYVNGRFFLLLISPLSSMNGKFRWSLHRPPLLLHITDY